MFERLSKMILDAQRKNPPVQHDPHRRGVITSPRATRRDGASEAPLIRTLW